METVSPSSVYKELNIMGRMHASAGTIDVEIWDGERRGATWSGEKMAPAKVLEEMDATVCTPDFQKHCAYKVGIDELQEILEAKQQSVRSGAAGMNAAKIARGRGSHGRARPLDF
eukprot:SAG22_NODE_531_length_9422_cov_86.532983_2_plen_115_part_00